MNSKILLITPPFTQLNTTYPATACLKGFLNTKNVRAFQADLSLEVFLELFSKSGLTWLFADFKKNESEISENSLRIYRLRNEYIKTIDYVIGFLQNSNPSLAFRICESEYLPQASRFETMDDFDWAFGTMGVQDKAKHLATLYIEDIGDFITECIDPYFGMSKYAERMAGSANSFDEIYTSLTTSNSFIDNILTGILENKIKEQNPSIVALSVPFPGNLHAALKCGQWIKKKYSTIKVVLGGGYANTEFRSLTEKRVFEFVDFICLDDGELPIYQVVNYVDNVCTVDELKRTFVLEGAEVKYYNNLVLKDFAEAQKGTPDYSDLLLDKYISVIEIVNPMHRLWSDGRWNKLTLAHGCYWAQCSFCDTSLDYIKRYEPTPAKLICDRIEKIIKQTGQTGFHFVDEAAPPSLLRELALEIIRRKLSLSWWTNVRFEKNFTADLCRLLFASGCIAVSGGLEVASERILKLINKGVTIEQVAKVTHGLTQAGIMVHAYLIYGFPGQTEQETIDSLEVVRQLFEQGLVQSAFWHQFGMSVHSPIGLNPEKYHTKIIRKIPGTFANNDIKFNDLKVQNHEKFSQGLRKSLFNFMHGFGYDIDLGDWFEFKTPKTTISPTLIESYVRNQGIGAFNAGNRIIWLKNEAQITYFTKNKNGQSIEMASMKFHSTTNYFVLKLERKKAEWLVNILRQSSVYQLNKVNYHEMKEQYEKLTGEDFQPFWYSKSMDILREEGLLVL